MSQETQNAGGDAGDPGPRVLIPPPLLFLGVVVIGLGLDWSGVAPWTFWILYGPLWMIGATLIFVGVLFMAIAISQFSGAATNVRTDLPVKALVKGGIYAVSRNPIYLGMTLITSGLSLATDTPVMLVALGVGLVILRFGVIAREEAYLARKFGDDYLQYKKRVGRWFWKY